MKTFNCDICKKYFLAQPCHKTGEHIYCSMECYGKSVKNRWSGYKSTKVIKICKNCGSEKLRYLSELKKSKSDFCSHKCYGEYFKNNNIYKGNKSHVWKDCQKEIECENCKKKFMRRKKWINFSKHNFCCYGCRREFIKGNNNPNWMNGISFELYPQEFNKELKQIIRNRFLNKCFICKVPEIEFFRKLDIHHIDYNKKNNSLNNLIPLCHKCHIMTNFNRVKWIESFKNTMGELICV